MECPFKFFRICWAIWENFNNKKISFAENVEGSTRCEGIGRTWRGFAARFKRIGKSEEQVIVVSFPNDLDIYAFICFEI